MSDITTLCINRSLRIGQERLNYQNSLMRIVEYHNSKNIVVEFQDEHKERVHTSTSNFDIGNVKNHFIPNVCGVGFLGCKKVKNREAYRCWVHMLHRCYNEIRLKQAPAYKGCTVCEEWHNYTNFEKWYEENYYTIDDEIMCLDKDILVKGNRVYSPNTCIFVPTRINTLFEKRNKSKYGMPIGVIQRRENKHAISYRAKCRNVYGKRITSKTFNNQTDCFYEYKRIKEETFKEAANLYKDKIPKKLYVAMCNWIIEEDD